MCAHKVIGMSVIGLTCAAVVASTYVEIEPNTKVISALVDGASASGCDPRIVHNYKPLPSEEEERRRNQIVGKWVGETAVEGGSRRRFLAEHFADGSMRVTFRTAGPDGRERFDQYVGTWGVSGPIFFTTVTGTARGDVFEAAKPGAPYNYNAYEILDINDEYFEYESFSPRAWFATRRVGDTFEPSDL